MKVVFLMQDTRAWYGAEQATFRLVAGLAAAGADVRVLLLQEARLGTAPSPLAEALRQAVPVTDVPVAGRFSRRAVAQIRDFMAAERADVLHATGYKADWHAVLASRNARLFPVVGTVHGWLFRWNLKERLYQALDLRALRRFSRVIVLCDFYERYLRRQGLSPLQIARIPTGVEAGRIVAPAEAGRLWTDPGEVFTFGLLGRLSSEKNHDLVLRAAVRLARELDTSPRPWRILIAGGGPRREWLRRRIARLGLADRVELAGWLPSPEFFRRVHVLVQCSRVENQPLSVLEAMAWLRPVIATRAGGLPELVRDGETGWLVPRRGVRALAAAMRACLVDPEAAEAAGRRGREVLERDYTFDRMVQEHLELYRAEARG